jgi:hypothetical protein
MNDTLYDLFLRQFKLVQGPHKDQEGDEIIPINVKKIFDKVASTIIDSNDNCATKNDLFFLFRDVTYTLFPIWESKTLVDNEATTNVLKGSYAKQIVLGNDTENNIDDFIARYDMFNINSLPLIEIADFLGIKVVKEKKIREDCVAYYSPQENMIVMGTDNPQVFLHELAHAIDWTLPNRDLDLDMGEIIAELTAACLCTIYNIPVNMVHSRLYIRDYAKGKNLKQCVMDALKRVEMIYQYIEKIHGR